MSSLNPPHMSELIRVMSGVMRQVDAINVEISSNETDALFVVDKTRELIRYGKENAINEDGSSFLEMELEDTENSEKIRIKIEFEVRRTDEI